MIPIVFYFFMAIALLFFRGRLAYVGAVVFLLISMRGVWIVEEERELLYLAIFATACLVAAGLYLARRRAIAREQPPQARDDERVVIVEGPSPGTVEERAPRRLPNWMCDGAEQLVIYVQAHRGVDADWRHLHEAAKAGRIDVLSRPCGEPHNISVLLTNKPGRNILHAAVNHRRYGLINWLIFGGDSTRPP